MELTAFTSRLGEGQGRLGPGVFVLGDHEPGRTFELGHGDHVEVQGRGARCRTSLNLRMLASLSVRMVRALRTPPSACSAAFVLS